MSSLEQLSCRYDLGEDRIQLSVSTSDQQEFRCWLTRRFTLSILNEFKQNTAKYRAPEIASTTSNPQDMADFQQASDTQGQDFSQKFKKGDSFPLGEEGFLVQTIHLTPTKGDGLTLTILPKKGQGINLNINKVILNNFFEVIERALEQTGWVQNAVLPSSNVLH